MEAVRVRHQYGTPVEIDALCADLGVSLEDSKDLHPKIIGQIKKMADDTFQISVATGITKDRRAFTIAHELGHLFLHRHLLGDGVDDNTAYLSTPDGEFNNPYISKRHEKEATDWALETLLPKRRMRLHCRKNGCAPEKFPEIAELFGVALPLLNYRLKDLGLVE
jgi:Zn-dependent peptidase ImmA (M78 family)